MAIITFWNNSKGRIGQTSSAIALATYFAVQENIKILLLSTGYGDTKAKKSYGYHYRNELVQEITSIQNASIDSGIYGLYKIALANRLTPESIQNYANTIYKDRLDVLEGIDSNAIVDYNKIYSSYKEIINVASKLYNVVFVDLNAGLENNETKIILEKSDIIITNIEQDIDEIKKFDELRFQNPIFLENNILVMINRYDKSSKYNSKNISRLLKIRPDALTVPYNTLYNEAMQEGKVDELFLNPLYRKTMENDKNEIFIQELQNDLDIINLKIKELHIRK